MAGAWATGIVGGRDGPRRGRDPPPRRPAPRLLLRDRRPPRPGGTPAGRAEVPGADRPGDTSTGPLRLPESERGARKPVHAAVPPTLRPPPPERGRLPGR